MIKREQGAMPWLVVMASDLRSAAIIALGVWSPAAIAAGWVACRPLLEKLWLRLRVWELGGGTILERRLDCDCSVCLEGLEPLAAVRTLSCDHVFHRKCIDKWLRDERMTCPICRQVPAPVLPWKAPTPLLSPSPSQSLVEVPVDQDLEKTLQPPPPLTSSSDHASGLQEQLLRPSS